MSHSMTKAVLRVVLPYLVVAGLWILLSDRLLERLLSSPEARTTWSIYKGWSFVLVTALLLAFLLRRELVASERVQVALRASEQEFRLLAEAMPQLVWMCRPDGWNLYFNQRWMDYTGLSLEESVGHGWSKPFHPDDQQRARDAWENAIATGGRYDLECRLRRADGTFHWFIIRGLPMRDATGKIIKWFGTCTDVDDLKQAEEAMRLSEEKFATAFANNPAAISLTRLADGLFLDVNDTWQAMTGYSRQEAIGNYARKMRIWPTTEAANRFVTELQEKGALTGWEQSFLNKSGGVFFAQVSAQTLTLRGEKVILSTLVDITEHKQNEAQLQSLIGVIQKMALAHDQSTVMAAVRSAARQLTGADGATFVLRDGNQCHYADEDAMAPLWKGQRFPMDTCISGWVMRHAQTVTIPDIYADPRIPAAAYQPTFVKSLAMAPIRTREPLGAIGCYWANSHQATHEELALLQTLADAAAVALENVSAYQLLERRVQERTAELRAANEELDAFSYAVSHDLRAPLRAMCGFSQAIVEDHGDRLPEQAREYLGEITLASRQMGELIDGLLRLSRCTRGELRRDTVDLSALAERCLGGLAEAEPDRRVTWTVEPGLMVQGDARMLEVALANLLGNAWKYTVGVPKPAIRFFSRGAGSGQSFCVADNGAGFDMKHAARLFQPFQRLHREDEFPGIGIGLATVQRIVHRHGGTIQATAAPGQGATFSFALGGSGDKDKDTL